MKEELNRTIWQSSLKSKTKYVMLTLAYFTEEDGYDGYTVSCPLSSMAELTGMCERTVKRHLRKLQKLGWIEVVEEARHHLPRVYKIKTQGIK